MTVASSPIRNRSRPPFKSRSAHRDESGVASLFIAANGFLCFFLLSFFNPICVTQTARQNHFREECDGRRKWTWLSRVTYVCVCLSESDLKRMRFDAYHVVSRDVVAPSETGYHVKKKRLTRPVGSSTSDRRNAFVRSRVLANAKDVWQTQKKRNKTSHSIDHDPSTVSMPAQSDVGPCHPDADH